MHTEGAVFGGVHLDLGAGVGGPAAVVADLKVAVCEQVVGDGHLDIVGDITGFALIGDGLGLQTHRVHGVDGNLKGIVASRQGVGDDKGVIVGEILGLGIQIELGQSLDTLDGAGLLALDLDDVVVHHIVVGGGVKGDDHVLAGDLTADVGARSKRGGGVIGVEVRVVVVIQMGLILQIGGGDVEGLFDHGIVGEIQTGDLQVVVLIHLHQQTAVYTLGIVHGGAVAGLQIAALDGHILHTAAVQRGEIALIDGALVRQGEVDVTAEGDHLGIIVQAILDQLAAPVLAGVQVGTVGGAIDAGVGVYEDGLTGGVGTGGGQLGSQPIQILLDEHGLRGVPVVHHIDADVVIAVNHHMAVTALQLAGGQVVGGVLSQIGVHLGQVTPLLLLSVVVARYEEHVGVLAQLSVGNLLKGGADGAVVHAGGDVAGDGNGIQLAAGILFQ